MGLPSSPVQPLWSEKEALGAASSKKEDISEEAQHEQEQESQQEPHQEQKQEPQQEQDQTLQQEQDQQEQQEPPQEQDQEPQQQRHPKKNCWEEVAATSAEDLHVPEAPVILQAQSGASTQVFEWGTPAKLASASTSSATNTLSNNSSRRLRRAGASIMMQ